MRLFQPDGSEAEMCGNGIRCLAKYAWETGYVGQSFDVETLAGIIPVQVREMDGSFWAKVDMGVPKFDRPSIPACGSGEFIMEEIEGLPGLGGQHRRSSCRDLCGRSGFRIRGDRAADKTQQRLSGRSKCQLRQDRHSLLRSEPSSGVWRERHSPAAREPWPVPAWRAGWGWWRMRSWWRPKAARLIITFEEGKAFMEGPAVTVYSGELSEEYRWSLFQEL